MAVKVADWPAQIVALFTLKIGAGLIVIVTGTNKEGHPAPDQLMVNSPLPVLTPEVTIELDTTVANT